ncbi:GSCOCG00001257001-RA-CDS [Cotesia congregata]|nr:GSCOCG00001257001-RA-CDS [Cotesia congregata]
MGSFIKIRSGLNVLSNFLKPRVEVLTIPYRERYSKLNQKPRKRLPPWLPKQTRTLYRDDVTLENRGFVKEVLETNYGSPDPLSKCYSPLKVAPIEPSPEWVQGSRRTGTIARKIGIYPMWLKNGKKVLATLLHICDNHVIKYIPPEEWEPGHRTRHIIPKRKLGCLVVGAESSDPQLYTKEYCGLFYNAGVMPKRLLSRFAVTPNGALQPGTPLLATHYRPGDVVDIRGKTIDRGFQGVMKRWGFHGMPATHGVTKTHRRPGNIGSGGQKARVMPGTKMPGHMGNRYRIFRGQKILRVNYKYNVIWVLGQVCPGETNSLVHVYDTLLPRRQPETPPPFPTFIPTPDTELSDEAWADDVHPFGAPTIEFEPEK